MIKRFLCFLSCLVFVCCTKTPTEKPPSSIPTAFTDITQQTGLNFVHEPGVDGSYFMPESMGSGGAFFDYNNDGYLDIYLINGNWHGKAQASMVKNRLYRQNRDGTFQDVTDSSGLGDPGYGMGVAVGDIDNDGDLDVYVTNFGGDSLYRNNGDGTFMNITNSAGIRNREWGTSAVFLDYDRDGYLDLYVANYVSLDPTVVCTDKAGRQDYCGPKGFQPTRDVLYHNNRDGTFEDVSRDSNIGNTAGKGLGVISADFNRDSFPDIYVANDGEENFLWINKQDGTFENQAVPLGAAVNALGQPEASMGVAAGDADDDQDLDLFMTHLREEKNTFYRNQGHGDFQDESWAAGLAGVSVPYTGFGTGYFDYDNDGDLDLAVVNGRVTRGPLLTKKQKPDYWDHYEEPNLLFENDGAGKFRVAPDPAGPFASTVENSRGLAFGDLDNDGDIDLLVTNEGGPARVYRNDFQKKGHWLIVRAVDPALKRDAIGAEITVSFQGKKIMRLLAPGYSYLSSSDPRVHFGLDTATAVETMEVRWPDGSIQKFPGTRADQFITLNKK
ncbi:CRTAC1 family protein [bacterium]|nr:CRTAC1 family protein [bacterium]